MTADLSGIRSLLAGITPGEWWSPSYIDPAEVFAGPGLGDDLCVAEGMTKGDAAFIAAAPSTVARLLGIVERVEALAAELSRDAENADHYAAHGHGNAKGVREATYGAEIAARIRFAIAGSINHQSDPTISNYGTAINAVLGLHKSEEWDSVHCGRDSGCEDCYPEGDDEGAGHEMLVCTECVGVTDDDNPGKVPYPCPTVTAIRAAITGEGA